MRACFQITQDKAGNKYLVKMPLGNAWQFDILNIFSVIQFLWDSFIRAEIVFISPKIQSKISLRPNGINHIIVIL